MPKINVYLPDELADAVREAGVPVSAVCQRALEQAVRRVAAIRETTVADLTSEDLPTRLPQFTARAHAVLRLAAERVGTEGAPTLGTGHLLAGLVAEGGNLALQVLRAVEIDPERAAGELGRQPSTEPGDEAPGRRLSRPAVTALELTVSEASGLGHNYVGCEHLLLGLLAEPDGVAGRVLRSLGAELRLTRRAVSAALAGYVHLRAQTGAGTPAESGELAAALRRELTSTAFAAALHRELAPVVARLERLERHNGLSRQE